MNGGKNFKKNIKRDFFKGVNSKKLKLLKKNLNNKN